MKIYFPLIFWLIQEFNFIFDKCQNEQNLNLSIEEQISNAYVNTSKDNILVKDEDAQEYYHFDNQLLKKIINN